HRRRLSRPRSGAGAPPSGRTVRRVPAPGTGVAKGPLRLRGGLRRRRAGLHPDRPRLPRRRLRTDGGAGRAVRGTADAEDGEGVAGAVVPGVGADLRSARAWADRRSAPTKWSTVDRA